MTDLQMLKMAKKELCLMDAAALIYVMETAEGNVHTVVNNDFQMTLDTLTQSGDTVVTKMVAMWKEGCIDVPSYAFRKVLLELNDANRYTKVILQSEIGYFAKPIGIMM